MDDSELEQVRQYPQTARRVYPLTARNQIRKARLEQLKSQGGGGGRSGGQRSSGGDDEQKQK